MSSFGVFYFYCIINNGFTVTVELALEEVVRDEICDGDEGYITVHIVYGLYKGVALEHSRNHRRRAPEIQIIKLNTQVLEIRTALWVGR